MATTTFYSVKSSAKPGDTVALSIAAPATSLEFNGLANGTAYTFVVSASNSYGQSPNSAPMVVAPNGVVLPPLRRPQSGRHGCQGDPQLELVGYSHIVRDRTRRVHPPLYSQIATSAALSFLDITVANGTIPLPGPRKERRRNRYSFRCGGSHSSKSVELQPRHEYDRRKL